MSSEDRKAHAAEHHNTTEENYDAAQMNVAREMGQRRMSNFLMNDEDRPNQKNEVKGESEVKDGASATKPNRKESVSTTDSKRRGSFIDRIKNLV